MFYFTCLKSITESNTEFNVGVSPIISFKGLILLLVLRLLCVLSFQNLLLVEGEKQTYAIFILMKNFSLKQTKVNNSSNGNSSPLLLICFVIVGISAWSEYKNNRFLWSKYSWKVLYHYFLSIFSMVLFTVNYVACLFS